MDVLWWLLGILSAIVLTLGGRVFETAVRFVLKMRSVASG